MPHFTIEHTDNAQPAGSWSDVFKTLLSAAAKHPTMKQADMKARARKLEAVYMDDGDDNKSFVHLELALLSGRDEALLHRIGEDLLGQLPPLFKTPDNCQFSLEIREMKRSNYFKQSQNS